MPTPIEQLLSRTLYTTDGATVDWDFSFAGGYLDPTHVKARTATPQGLRTELTVTPEMLIGQYQLRVTPALAAGNTLTIYRNTPKDLPLVDFTDESGFSEVALDTNAKQAIMVAAETADEVNTSDINLALDAKADAVAAAAAASASAAAALASETAAAGYAAAINPAAFATAAQGTLADTAVQPSDLSVSGGASTVGWLAAGAGAAATTVQAKLREHVSPKDFGAVGDNVTDDTAAVQSWLNVAGPLELTAGTYLVDQLTVSSNTTITGTGTLKARSTQNSVLYILDKSNVTIDGIKVDGDGKVLSCIRAYTNVGAMDAIAVKNCRITGAKNDATLQYGGIEVSRLGSNRATNITITDNRIYNVGSHGAIVAYADGVTISDNVLNSIGQHGAEAVDCTRVNQVGNRIYHCGTVGPGGSGLGVGTNCAEFTIAGNTIHNCAGDASITVEHNSVQGTVSGNTIKAARTSGINVSFGTAGAAPFDVVRDVTVSGNTVIGDGTNTTNRSGILVYSSSAASGTGITVTGNTVRKFNIGLNMSYVDDSTVSGNAFGDYVGASTHAMTYTFCRRVGVVGNVGGACSGNVVQILNQSTNHCDHVNVTGLSGSSPGFAMVYVEGDLTHVLTGLDTTSSSSWVSAASGASTISVIGCRGNLSSTPIVATLSGVIIGNNPPTHDYLQLIGAMTVRAGAGTPEGVVTAPVGSMFLRSNGGAGTAFYVKESGAGNTGWVAK